MKKLARYAVLNNLKMLQLGQITLQEGQKEWIFGTPGPHSVTVKILDESFYKKLLVGGSLGAAESYIAGEWQTNNLTALLRIILQNQSVMSQLDRWYSKPLQLFRTLGIKFRKNTLKRSRENIHSHYDLGNEFFQTFLDKTMMYSCAIYASPTDDLHQAQLTKIKKIAEKLSPTPQDHILEIGTGWGGLAIYLAQQYNCHVTTTTISNEQYQYVKERINALNLSDKITLLNQDYRQLKGQFDKIVSIEMIEAVGQEYFDMFFKKCDDLLKPDGLLILQAITINEQSYRYAIQNIDFIKRYIFPGGCLPSIRRIGDSIAESTHLEWVHLTNIGKHYAQTLRHWHESLLKNINTLKNLGFSEQFIRLWQYYFCYCEAGFEERYISDVQIVFQKRC